MATLTAAYPFIEVNIDTSAMRPIAQRAPGVLAIVGKTAAGAAGGEGTANQPYEVDSVGDAALYFASTDQNGVLQRTPLYNSLELAINQSPRPAKIYGVRTDDQGDYGPALTALEGMDDVTFVSLADETTVGQGADNNNPASTGLHLLKDHVENMSSQGLKRIGVAMIDNTTQRSPNYVGTITGGVESLRSGSSRMVLVAARGAQNDVAAAAAGAIAGYPPEASMVLKQIRNVSMPKDQQFSPSEIKGLSEDGINPVIHPSLIPGEGFYFAEARTFTADPDTPFIDIVRVLDDIDYRLKAGLIGSIGDARITKTGMTLVKTRTEGILGPLQRNAVIDDFDIRIPVLDILGVPQSTWTATDTSIVQNARATRTVEMIVSVTYGPAVHRLMVKLAPHF